MRWRPVRRPCPRPRKGWPRNLQASHENAARLRAAFFCYRYIEPGRRPRIMRIGANFGAKHSICRGRRPNTIKRGKIEVRFPSPDSRVFAGNCIFRLGEPSNRWCPGNTLNTRKRNRSRILPCHPCIPWAIIRSPLLRRPRRSRALRPRTFHGFCPGTFQFMAHAKAKWQRRLAAGFRVHA